MYGQIHVIVRSLVLEKFGQEAWQKVLERSTLDDIRDFMVFHRYSDSMTVQLITACSECLGAPLTTVLEIFGEHFLSYCYRNGYDKMLMTLGKDFVSFMQNLDSLHALLSLTYKNFDAPSFRCSEKDENGVVNLDYFSVRAGLHHIVTGLLRAVGRDLFNIEVSSKVMTVEEIKITDTLTQHHVAFEVLLGKPVCEDKEETKRATKERLSDEVQPFTSDAYREMNSQRFSQLFSFHFVFNKELVLKQCGAQIEKLSHGKIRPGKTLAESFNLTHPHIALTWDNILKFITAVYNLEMIDDSELGRRIGGFVLKGAMVRLEAIDHIIFIGSPRLESLDEMEDRDIYLSDIPLFDVTRELVLLNQQRMAEIEVSKKLDEAIANVKKTSRALEFEKVRADELLYQMLPEKVATQLKEGKKVSAEKFDLVTILFSDMPAFGRIAEKVQPIVIVDLLNSLYALFDALTEKNNVYKVETIGDVYFVVSGLPERCDNHAELVANQGLDMVVAAKKVKNPVDKTPINVRVGLHTGPVVTGVVGLRMPRYCLFGDTVNTSSRMESHGAEGRVHCSPSLYEQLKDKDYKFVDRGLTAIKGKGEIHTYWLYANKTVKLPKPSPQLPAARSGSTMKPSCPCLPIK